MIANDMWTSKLHALLPSLKVAHMLVTRTARLPERTKGKEGDENGDRRSQIGDRRF